MICPRCGQRIPAGLLERCPICGQPFYPPMTKISRVIKLPPEESGSQPASESDTDDGADTFSLPVTQSATVGQSRLAAGGFGLRTLRRLPAKALIIAGAALLLVFSGGLVLVAGMHQRENGRTVVSLPGRTETGTVQKSHPSSVPTATSSARPVAVATKTSPPPAATASATPVSPSPAPATATSQPAIVFSDPLTSNANGWPVKKGCSFTANGYQVQAGAQCIAPVTATDTESISVQITGNVWFNGTGIGFRLQSGQPNDQYSFTIGSGGSCMANDQANSTVLFNAASCTLVKQGLMPVNVLTIKQSGSHMDFYVNGGLAGSADDATLSGGGIALEVGKISAPVVFSNFVITPGQ